MIDQNTAQWLLYGAITLAALLAALHVVTSLIRNLTYVHDVQCSVAKLHNEYTRDMLRLRGIEAPELLDESDIVDIDDEGTPQTAAPIAGAIEPESALTQPDAAPDATPQAAA